MGQAARVLVIDDEEIIRTLSEKILARYGYEIATVATGEEGVAVFGKALETGEPFDVVLLDLTLGETMSGTETLKRLKEIDDGIRCIVCSGNSAEPAVLNWSRHGFAGAVLKPFRAEDLAGAIEKVIGDRE